MRHDRRGQASLAELLASSLRRVRTYNGAARTGVLGSWSMSCLDFSRTCARRGTGSALSSLPVEAAASTTRGALRTVPPAAARRRKDPAIEPRSAAQNTSADGPARNYEGLKRTPRCISAV